MKFLKYSFLVAAMACSSAQAGIFVDFTSNDWSGAQGQTSFSVGDITITSSIEDSLTFNDPDYNSGCGAGDASQTNLSASTGLDCIGDGIGIGDDEITQSSNEVLTVTFTGGPVNILGIDLLDLFATEQGGESAVINTLTYKATGNFNPGGFWETGFTFDGLNTLKFTGMNDAFSDYSLARIEYESASVPEPGVIALFGAGLMGLGFARRKARKS